MRKMNKGMAALAAAIMTALPTGVMAATNSAQAKQETKFETSFTKNEREPRPVRPSTKMVPKLPRRTSCPHRRGRRSAKSLNSARCRRRWAGTARCRR